MLIIAITILHSLGLFFACMAGHFAADDIRYRRGMSSDYTERGDRNFRWSAGLSILLSFLGILMVMVSR